MADGAVVFGSGLNSSCMTSRAKKVNNNNSVSTAANMRRKTRQSNRRDIHNRVRLKHDHTSCFAEVEQARETQKLKRVFLILKCTS